MTSHVIVSYDDSQNDRDGLMLGRLFHDVGATLTLAYIRHAPHASLERDLLAAREADELLERGIALLGDPYTERRVVMSPSTSVSPADVGVTPRRSRTRSWIPVSDSSRAIACETADCV